MTQLSAQQRIVQARVDFLMEQPFFGQIAVRLELCEADAWCPTMAVDGVYMYYNTEFVSKLSDSELKFVVAHEVMHCVYQHFLRLDGRDARLWNCAGDYVINQELSDLRIGTMPQACKMPNWEEDQDFYCEQGISATDPGGLIDSQYRGMYTEQVYDLLKKDAEQQGKHANQKVKNWDVHLEPGSDSGTGEDGDTDGDSSDGPVKLDSEQLARLSDELKQAVQDAARTADELKGAGSVPGGVRRLIAQWTESRVDWRQFLTNTVLSTVRSDYTWSRSSRKGRDQGIYLPGTDQDDQVNVHIAIDTSGSISQADIAAFLGEVKGIMDQFADFEITVWCFDTLTHTVRTYDSYNSDELEQFAVEGGGGTDYECNWHMLKSEGIVPNTLILFTDGWPFGGWGDPDYCDTVFLIKDNPRAQAPFGTTVHYEESAA